MKTLIGVFILIAFFQGAILYQKKTLEQSISDGKEIYKDFCLQCHLDTGEGVSGVFPPLAKSDYLLNNIDLSIKGIKFGMSGPILVNEEEYDGIMQDQGLEDQEIADVMNYILNNWGNQSNEIITSDRVATITE